MCRYLVAFIAGFLLLGLSNSVSAQVTDLALGQAKARLACGAGTVVSSQFLPNGSLEVTCSQSVPEKLPSALDGAGLTAPTALGALAVVTLLLVITNDTTSGTTTTATPAPTPTP